jgi:adenylate cyclase
MNPKKYIAELKRRHVFKAAIAYLLVAWLIAQVASIVLPSFEAPPNILKNNTLIWKLSAVY